MTKVEILFKRAFAGILASAVTITSMQLIDTKLFTANAETHLDRIDLEVSEPIAGKTPADMTASYTTDHISVKTDDPQPIRWYENGSATPMLETAVFSNDKTYEVRVEFLLEDGYTVNNTTTAYVNGVSHTLATDTEVNNTEVTYTFGKTMSIIAVTMDSITIGEPLVATAEITANNGIANVESVHWFKNGSIGADGDAAVYGIPYTVEVVANLNSGYRVASNQTATLNGQVASVEAEGADNVKIKFNFTPLQDPDNAPTEYFNNGTSLDVIKAKLNTIPAIFIAEDKAIGLQGVTWNFTPLDSYDDSEESEQQFLLTGTVDVPNDFEDPYDENLTIYLNVVVQDKRQSAVVMSNVQGGTYSDNQSIVLFTNDPNADIWYTTDGTDPSSVDRYLSDGTADAKGTYIEDPENAGTYIEITNSTEPLKKYTAPITISGDDGKQTATTIKAYSTKDYQADSSVSTFAYTIDKSVKFVKLSATAPVAGVAATAPTISNSPADDAFELGDVVWSPTLLTGDKFDYNEVYTMTVPLELQDGYSVSPSALAIVTVSGVEHLAMLQKVDATNYQVTYTFDPTAERMISLVSFDVDAPVGGATPATELDPVPIGFSDSAITWDPNDATFKYDTEYTMTVMLTLDSANGYEVADLALAIVNGKYVVPLIKVDNTTYKVTYTFDTTADHSMSMVSFTNITAPVANTVATTSLVAPEGFSAANISWSSTLEDGNKFGYNKVYTMTIKLTLASGYTIEDSALLNLNDKYVLPLKDNGDGTCQAEYTFERTHKKLAEYGVF